MIDTGGPAFPNGTGWNHEGNWVGGGDNGMTLRDYFAAKAMQGIQARSNWSVADVAATAYLQADAMLKARDGNS